MEQLIQQAIERMRQEAAQEQMGQLGEYHQRIQTALAKINAFKRLNESNLLESSSIQWNDSNRGLIDSSESSATKILQEDTYRIAYGKALLDGYHILTEFGTFIRNDKEVKYSVTATGIQGGSTYKITWEEMPFEEFANLVNFNIGSYYNSKGQAVIEGLRLRGVAKLFRQGMSDTNSDLYQKLNDKSQSIGKMFRWDDETEVKLYQQFVKRARNIKVDNRKKWQKVNEGNLLEAFQRFRINTGDKIPITKFGKLSNQAYSAIREAMEQTMNNPGAFYTGGDIGHLQIKGNAATIAEASTIETMLQAASNSIRNMTMLLSSGSSLSADNAVVGEISQSIQKDLDNFIKALITPYFH